MRMARRNPNAIPRGPNFSHVGDRPLGPHEVVWNGLLERQRATATIARPRMVPATPKGVKAERDVSVPGSMTDRLAAFVTGNPGALVTSHQVAALLGVDTSRASVILQRIAKRGLLQPAGLKAPEARTGRPPVIYRAAVSA